MKRTNFYYSDEQLERVKLCADATGRTMIDVIRAAIDEYLGQAKPKQAKPIAELPPSRVGFSVATTEKPEPQVLSGADLELLRQRDANLQAKPITVLKDRPMLPAKAIRPSRYGFQPPSTLEEKAERIERIFRGGGPKPVE